MELLCADHFARGEPVGCTSERHPGDLGGERVASNRAFDVRDGESSVSALSVEPGRLLLPAISIRLPLLLRSTLWFRITDRRHFGDTVTPSAIPDRRLCVAWCSGLA